MQNNNNKKVVVLLVNSVTEICIVESNLPNCMPDMTFGLTESVYIRGVYCQFDPGQV